MKTVQTEAHKYHFLKRLDIECLRTEFGPRLVIYGKIDITEHRPKARLHWQFLLRLTLREAQPKPAARQTVE